MLGMEDVAKKFEQEKDIQLKVNGKKNCSCGANTLTSMSMSCIFSIAGNECMQDQDLQVCKKLNREMIDVS